MKVAKSKSIGTGLEKLWKSKFFLRPKETNEITKELGKKGYNFTPVALRMSLRRAKYLMKKNEKWPVYIQRYPYADEDED